MSENKRNTELLKEISNLNEKFVAEACEPEVINLSANKKNKRIWKIVATVAACFIVVIASGSVLFGTNMFRMGNSATESADMVMVTEDAYDSGLKEKSMYVDTEEGFAAPMASEPQAYSGAMDAVYDVKEGETYNGGMNRDANQDKKQTEAKLIYTANVSIQTTRYDEEVQKIKDLVEEYDGYIQNTDTYNGGYYDTEVYKNGYFSVRIPQEKYKDFLTGIDSNSHITNLSENVQDVGEYYFDLESKLKMYRTKEERLQTLLKKANSLSDIIEIESALTEVQSEINMYQSDLNHYDSLIGYSTINIDICQVAHVGSGYDQDNGFFARLGRNFINGLRGFAHGIENFIMWIARNIVPIVIIAAAIIVIWKFHLIKWIKEHIKR